MYLRKPVQRGEVPGPGHTDPGHIGKMAGKRLDLKHTGHPLAPSWVPRMSKDPRKRDRA